MFNRAVILCASLALMVVAGMFSVAIDQVQAQSAGAPLTGYAWSTNYGKIEFSHSQGGVTIDSSGNFSGYAWANPKDDTATPPTNNIGWFNFGNTTCPSGISATHPTDGNCRPHVDFVTGKVTGFAYVLSTGEYMSLSGANQVSPTADGSGGVTFVPGTKKFVGKAWGAQTDASGNIYGAGWTDFAAGGAECSSCNSAFTVSCSASAATVATGVTVTWTATVTGGLAGEYNYAWSGTDALSGATASVTKAYTTTGSKTAMVKVVGPDDTEIEQACTGTVEVTDANGAIKVTRVGDNGMPSTAPSTQVTISGEEGNVSANPADYTGKVPGTYTVYSSNLEPSYAISVGSCTYVQGQPECNVETFNGASCSGGFCDTSVNVTGGSVTKVAFKYVSSDGASVDLTANPTAVNSGDTSTLTWTAVNANNCTASGGWTGSKSENGSEQTGSITSNTTYDISCVSTINPAQTVTDSVTVTIATYQCSDDVNNNDGDNFVDEDDPGCYTDNDKLNGTYDPYDNSEYNYLAKCSNGSDDDGDGKIDAADPGCHVGNDINEAYLPNDETEENDTQCSDRTDNDGDGYIDYPFDPGCDSLADDNETNSDSDPKRQCNDAVDNDDPEDTYVDFGQDPGCDSRADNNEVDQPICSNGVDDDLNGTVDDPGECKAQCEDGRDNDFDGKIDYNGLDVNGDGVADIAADPGCTGPTDDNESDVPTDPPIKPLAPKVDIRVRKILFDPATGNRINTNFVNSNSLEIGVGDSVELQWRVTGKASVCYAEGRPSTSSWKGYKSTTIGTEVVYPTATTWFDITCLNGFTPAGTDNKDSIRVTVKGANED